jgi:hypothetical protein
MVMAVKTSEKKARWRRAAAAPTAWGTPFPAAGKVGERRPLASLLHGFKGALPHGDGIHGGGKNVAFGG